MELPLQTLPAGNKEYFLKLEAVTRKNMPLIPAGHIAAMEQWQLPIKQIKPATETITGTLQSERTPESLTLNGTNFRISFSTQSGEMTALEYNGKNLIKEGLQATWKHAGENATLKDIRMEESADKQLATVIATYDMAEQESALEVTYRIRPNGIVGVTMQFTAGKKQLPEMPRLGMRMVLPAEYEQMTWLGRGPQENYADRKTGAAIGLYNATVWEQYHPYVRAQETGNKCDVRWVALRNAAGEGLLVKPVKNRST